MDEETPEMGQGNHHNTSPGADQERQGQKESCRKQISIPKAEIATAEKESQCNEEQTKNVVVFLDA